MSPPVEWLFVIAVSKLAAPVARGLPSLSPAAKGCGWCVQGRGLPLWQAMTDSHFDFPQALWVLCTSNSQLYSG